MASAQHSSRIGSYYANKCYRLNFRLDAEHVCSVFRTRLVSSFPLPRQTLKPPLNIPAIIQFYQYPGPLRQGGIKSALFHGAFRFNSPSCPEGGRGVGLSIDQCIKPRLHYRHLPGLIFSVSNLYG